MTKIGECIVKTRNPARKPWHLKGKGPYIVELRHQGYTFAEIGFRVGCTGEGARQAYNREVASGQQPHEAGAHALGEDRDTQRQDTQQDGAA
jgi:hypothetical protein